MKSLLSWGGLALWFALMAPLYGQTVQVKWVVDGDTFITDHHEKIRVVGIDTPELGHGKTAHEPFAVQARQLTGKLVLGKSVQLTLAKEAVDTYGRTMAYVTLADGSDLAEHLLTQGLAMVMIIPPNLDRIQRYLQLENMARSQHLAIWQEGRGFILNWLDAHLVGGHHRLIQGRVVQIHETKKRVYLNLATKKGGNVAISIRPHLWQTLFYHNGMTKNNLLGRAVVARGKVAIRGRAAMWLNHPWQLQLSPQD